MRVPLLLYFALILAGCAFAACTPTEVATVPTATPRGPIVPTRVIPTETPTATPTLTSTPTDTFTPAPTATATLTFTLTPVPTDTATPLPPSATNTLAPSDTPQPTATDTLAPTDVPTNAPTPTTPPSATTESTQTVIPPTLAPAQSYNNSTALEPVRLNELFTLGSTVSGTIDNRHPVQLYPIAGAAGTVLDIAMTATSGDLDPFLVVLDPKGREIVRNDDVDANNRNAAVNGLILPENGIYVIVASRYQQMFGEDTGDFDLSITEGTTAEAQTGSYSTVTGYDSFVDGSLDSTHTEDLYTFRAAAGDMVTIQMSNSSGDLDPRLTLTDNLGNPLVSNDDNLATGTLDSSIQGYILRRAGYYTIIATRYTGSDNSGGYRLKLVREAQNESGVYAPLDPVNSRTINETGDYFINYSAGDIIGDDNVEHALQTLLTFRLPTPPAENFRVVNASLILAPCYERGGGFSALGDLTIYQENIGRLSQAVNVTHPLPGARILTTQASCAPIDVTALVQNIYATGNSNAQFRLTFRDRQDNGSEDEVQFTPGLLLKYGQ